MHLSSTSANELRGAALSAGQRKDSMDCRSKTMTNRISAEADIVGESTVRAKSSSGGSRILQAGVGGKHNDSRGCHKWEGITVSVRGQAIVVKLFVHLTTNIAILYIILHKCTCRESSWHSPSNPVKKKAS